MINAISERIRVVSPGEPQGPQLRVLPILGPSHDVPQYRLLDADTLPRVQVTEVSEAGSVPELLVENQLDVRVFLMDGQELVGAKQNRILNTDVLVPANASLKIPVSCVEQGRWQHISAAFVPGKSASHATRSAKQERVRSSLRKSGRHDADQAAVWAEVGSSLAHSGATSATMALSDAYTKKREELDAFRRSLELPPDTVGVAVFQGAAFKGLDLFDRHTTLRYFWEPLIDSYAIELLATGVEPAAAKQHGEHAAVQETLGQAAAGQWERFRSPGEGEEWRLEHPGLSGTALTFDEHVLVHLQLFPRQGPAQPPGPTPRPQRPRIHRPYGPAGGPSNA